jgi:DNA-binding CsgD family transcriptional regulator
LDDLTDRGLSVAVYADSAVLRRGLEAMLQELAIVKEVTVCGSVEHAKEILRENSSTALILADSDRRRLRLTDREKETLGLLVEGLSNKQIARRLRISSHGAKRLVASLMAKLDAPNRTTAVVKSIRMGLIQPENPIISES